MTKKELKAEIKAIWVDQIKTAIAMANEAVIGNTDGGTCNFDMAIVKKEKQFTYAETIAIFQECGIRAYKMSGFYNGCIGLPNFVGQAEKNTVWAETFSKWLGEQGFETSMYYQCD